MKVLFEYGNGLAEHELFAFGELVDEMRRQLVKGENVKTLPPDTGWFARFKKRLAYHPDIVHRNGTIRRLGLIRPKTFVLPGIDPKRYHPLDAGEKAEFRKARHLPEHYLLMCGPDIPVRNLMTVVSAMRRMDSTATLPLVIPGLQRKSAVRREVERRRMDDCLFAIDDVSEKERPALFASAALYLDPGLGSAARQGIIEAMACGVPVVASATNVSRKLFGSAAKLVHPRDAIEWARALNSAQISVRWRESAVAAGLELARKYEWPLVAAKLLNLYRKLFEKSFFNWGRLAPAKEATPRASSS